MSPNFTWLMKTDSLVKFGLAQKCDGIFPARFRIQRRQEKRIRGTRLFFREEGRGARCGHGGRMTDLIMTSLIALLVGAVGLLSYFLGKRTVKNEEYERAADRVRGANAARASLRDNSVVERLHDKYKR